jgi:hypothetical protein
VAWRCGGRRPYGATRHDGPGGSEGGWVEHRVAVRAGDMVGPVALRAAAMSGGTRTGGPDGWVAMRATGVAGLGGAPRGGKERRPGRPVCIEARWRRGWPGGAPSGDVGSRRGGTEWRSGPWREDGHERVTGGRAV